MDLEQEKVQIEFNFDIGEAEMLCSIWDKINSKHNQYQLAQQLWADGKLQEALELCKGIIKMDPHNWDARFLAACIFEMQGAYESAIVLIENILKDQPSPEYEVYVRANLSLDYLEVGQYGKAEDCCRRSLELNPNNFENNNNLAYTLNNQGRFKESYPYAKKACHLNPNDAGALGNLGEACLALNILAEAVEAFERSVSLTNPADFMIVMREAKLDIARSRLRTQKEKGPSKSYPKSVSELQQEASKAQEMGDFQEAAEYLGQAIADDPNNPILHNNLAHALYRQGKLEDAIIEFKMAIKLNPEVRSCYFDISEVWSSLDNPDEALKNLVYGLILLRRQENLDTQMIEEFIGKKLEGFFARLGLNTPQVREAYILEKEKELDKLICSNNSAH